MHPSANTAGGRRVTRWTRETIIEKIREWNDRYGEPPCSADWNPSLARWRAQEWRAERYRDGFWPSTNAAKRPFDGSFDAAVRAAGLEPHRSGPRRRPAGAAKSRRGAARADGPPQRRRGAGGGRRARARRGASRRRAGAGAGGRRASCRPCRGPAGRRAHPCAPRRRPRASCAAGARSRAAGRAGRVRADRRADRDAEARVRAAYDQAQAAVSDTRRGAPRGAGGRGPRGRRRGACRGG